MIFYMGVVTRGLQVLLILLNNSFSHKDTKGLRSLLSFIEKKVAKKATTASEDKATLPCYLFFSVLQNSLKLAPSKFFNVQTVSDWFRKE